MRSIKTPAVADRLYTQAREHRKTLSPKALAAWKPQLRKKDVEQLLKASLVNRLPRLTPVRFERMAASPFGFFRG